MEDKQENVTKINEQTEISLSVKKTKPLSYTQDELGDFSSKRLISLILLTFSIVAGISGIVLVSLGVMEDPKIVLDLSTTWLGGSLVAAGLTGLEHLPFSNKGDSK